MRWLMVVAMLMSGCAATATPAVHLGVAPLTQKVFRDSEVGALPNEGLELWGAGNEKVSVQLVITAGEEALKGVTVSLSGDLVGPGEARIAADRVELMEVAYVTAPGLDEYYPDPLPPLQGSLEVPVGENQPIWVKVSIPQYCTPRLYEGALIVGAVGVESVQVPLRVHVWPFTLPVRPHLRTAFGLFGEGILKAHNVQDSSVEAKAIAQRYQKILLDHCITPRDLPVTASSAEGLMYMRDPRGTSFVTSPDDIAFLSAHGLLHNALFYPVDEPSTQEQRDRLIEAGRRIHGLNPAAKIITSGPAPVVEGAIGTVDIWCSMTSSYVRPDFHPLFKERQALGEEVWTYVCCGPGPPYCNFFVDMEGICHRLLFWQIRQERLQGLLYWTITFWRDIEYNPWHDIATVKWISSDIYGDGSLLYPGSKVGIDGPVSSQRLECILAGMQDIEYFTLLQQVAGEEAIQSMIAELVTDFTHYSKDDAKLEQLRRWLGETLAAH